MWRWIRSFFRRKKPVIKKPVVIDEGFELRKVNDKAIDLICEFEGFRASPYKCSAGVWTIGFGTTYYPDGNRVRKDDPSVSIEYAKTIFHENLKKYSLSVQKFLEKNNLEVNNNQFGALVSLAYNCGAGVITSSGRSMNLALLSGSRSKINNAFMLYVKAGRKTLRGLVRRRKEEVRLYNEIS